MRLFARAASLVLVLVFVACAGGTSQIRTNSPFPPDVESRLTAFFARTDSHTGRKVAVFDGDGTVIGQVPHYLADECMYQYALAHPDHRPELIREMTGQSNVSLPYVQGRVRFLAGMGLEETKKGGR